MEKLSMEYRIVELMRGTLNHLHDDLIPSKENNFKSFEAAEKRLLKIHPQVVKTRVLTIVPIYKVKSES